MISRIAPITALALRLAFPAFGQPSVDCSSEPEDKFVRGSTGAIIGAPFQGNITVGDEAEFEFPDHAWFSRASEKCPQLKLQDLEIDPLGNFRGKVSIPTDTHWYCRNGKLVKQQWIESPELLLFVPGCVPRSIRVIYDQEDPIKFLCERLPEGEVYREGPPAVSTGASIVVAGTQLLINGIEIEFPTPIELLKTALGTPSKVVEAAGDQYSNDVYEWESRGVYAYSRPEAHKAHALGAALDAEHNPRHWCNPGLAELTVNGIDINHQSTPGEIGRAGFRGGSYAWEIRAGSKYFTLDEIGIPPIYVEFEAGRSNR